MILRSLLILPFITLAITLAHSNSAKANSIHESEKDNEQSNEQNSENYHADKNSRLLDSCQQLMVRPTADTAAPCLYYIEGFIAGSLTQSPKYLADQSQGDTKLFGITDRYRSRDGGRGQIPPKREMRACVTNDIDNMEKVVDFIANTEQEINTLASLRHRVHEAINNEFPCQ